MSETGLVRDVFNKNLVIKIGNQLKQVHGKFDLESFVQVGSDFDSEFGFKERAHQITKALTLYLPNDFSDSAKIIKSTFSPLNETKEENWDSFIYMPYGLFVEQYGCNENTLEVAFDLLKEITMRFTSEFAIRAFIIEFPEQTISKLKAWSKHENHHVRRLVSEGSRPRLPWAQAIVKFKNDPTPALELLEVLRNDDSKYVQKSVANHINDITKDNPKIALSVLARWKKENNPNTNWIVKHALRSELKKGTPKALEILGYSLSPNIEIRNFNLNTDRIKVGDYLTFEFEVVNMGEEIEHLMVDYICHFMKANGKTAPKTFKISSKKLKPNESFSVKKKQSFKLISTRKMYSGEHQIEIFINGKSFDVKTFELKA